MPTLAFTYTIILRGTDNEKSTLNYDLGTITEGTNGECFDVALSAAASLRAALDEITDAFVAEESLHHIISEDSQLPAAADVFEEALISVHLNPPVDAEKVHPIRVPAPVIGMFIGTTGAARDVVDVTDLALQEYVLELASNFYLSDGEQVNTTHPNAGIKRGFRNIRKRRLGR